jgi:hypothetical protein
MTREKNLKNKKGGGKKRDYTAVLLEKMNDKIDIVAEGHSSLNRKIDGIKEAIAEFKYETRTNFKEVFERLSRIEDEFNSVKHDVAKLKLGKTDWHEFEWIKNKVLDLEKKLKGCQKQQALFAAKA